MCAWYTCACLACGFETVWRLHLLFQHIHLWTGPKYVYEDTQPSTEILYMQIKISAGLFNSLYTQFICSSST